MTITTIIFSFDRAMQLDLFLDSIIRFDEKKALELNIVYNTSNQEFTDGYEKLITDYPI